VNVDKLDEPPDRGTYTGSNSTGHIYWASPACDPGNIRVTSMAAKGHL